MIGNYLIVYDVLIRELSVWGGLKNIFQTGRRPRHARHVVTGCVYY